MSDKQNIIIGRHPIVEAIKNDTAVEKVFIQKSISPDFDKEIRNLCRERGVAFQYVPKEKLNRLTRKNHQGVVAFASLISFSKIEDIIPFIYEKSDTPLFLVLDGITDVRNFGAIARSAELCGVHAIIVPEKGGAAINEDSMKTSAGALSRIPVCKEKKLRKVLEEFKLNGIQVCAAVVNTEKMIYDCDLKVPSAIIMGSEHSGVSKSLLEEVDQTFKIPQKGEIDSFNVSVAAGIILYETIRQRS